MGALEKLEGRINKLKLLGIDFGICKVDKEVVLSSAKVREGIERITIPEGVTLIGYQAFKCCKDVKEVRLASSIKAINIEGFRDAAV